MPKIRKAYKFRLKTNSDIEQKLLRILGCSRFLWNKSLALILSAWKRASQYSGTRNWPSG